MCRDMVNAIISKVIGRFGSCQSGCLGVVTIVAADCTYLDKLKAYFRLQQLISDNLRITFISDNLSMVLVDARQ